MPSVSYKFCTAKVAGEGEDADPILRVGPDLGLLGVFDGMGGAGGTVYDTPDGRHSGAYIASRFARNVVERLMLELIKPEWNLDGPATAAELHRLLEHEVAREFYDRDADGLPRAWLQRVKRSLATNGPEFSATRMVQDYVRQFYKGA